MTLLRERMQHDMLIRNLAENTQKSYLLQVSSFAKHFHRSPELLGPEEIRAWLVYLREERKLAPGSIAVFEDGKLAEERYWNLRFAPQQRSAEDFVEELRHHLFEAVRLRLVSDVPLGAFLSGGID